MFSWRPTGDSACYAFEDIPMEQVLSFCKQDNISLNVFLVKALSETLQEKPQINSTIRFWKIYPRKENVIFFHIMRSAEDEDLSGIRFREAYQQPLETIQQQYRDEIRRYQAGTDDFSASKKLQKILPTFCIPIVMKLYSWFAYNFNVNLGLFKMPKSAFGSVMLTAIGQLGVQEALCPIAPYTRVPMVVSIGKKYDKLVMQNGVVVEKPYIRFGFTFDHRIMDGIHFAEFLHVFKSKFEPYD